MTSRKVSPVPADGLAPGGARPSAGTVLPVRLGMASTKFIWLSRFRTFTVSKKKRWSISFNCFHLNDLHHNLIRLLPSVKLCEIRNLVYLVSIPHPTTYINILFIYYIFLYIFAIMHIHTFVVRCLREKNHLLIMLRLHSGAFYHHGVRLLHSLSLVDVGLSVGYETWLLCVLC